MTKPTNTQNVSANPVSGDETGDWRHRAACREKDPELFFPVGTTGPALAQTREAKAVCWLCPVRTDCLTWALTTGQDAGIWGGLDENERRKLKRHRSRQGRVTTSGTSAVRAS